jgi:hypothetical protein
MHRTTLCVATAGLLAITATPTAAQGFQGVMQFVSYERDSGAPDTLTQMTKGSKIRIEGMGMRGGAMIMNGNTRIILMPEQKQYMIMPMTSDKADRVAKEKKNGVAVRTGKTETVAGIPCEVWHYTAKDDEGKPDTGDACLAKGAGFMVNRLAGDNMAQYFSEGGAAFGEALASGMGIMKVVSNGKVELIAIRAQASSLPDAMFAAPADYKPLDLSKMGGMHKP